MSLSHAPDRARKYKEDPAPVASQKMVSCLCFPALSFSHTLASPHPLHRPYCTGNPRPLEFDLLRAPTAVIRRCHRSCWLHPRSFCSLQQPLHAASTRACCQPTHNPAQPGSTQLGRPQTTWYALPRQVALVHTVAGGRAATQAPPSAPPCRPCRTSAGRLVALLSLRRVLSLSATQRHPCHQLDLRAHRPLCCQRRGDAASLPFLSYN